MRPLDLSKALLRCGLLVFTVNSARAQKVSSAKGSSKGSMPPSDIPSSYPSLMPSQVPSARPSSSPSQEGTRKFVLCYGEKNVTSTSTVDDVEAALDEVKASMFAARTAAAGTSEEFVEKVMKFKDVTLPLKEQADLLWTSSVALGAGLVVDEYKVTQSLIQGELEATYMEFFEILEISNILYSKFGMTNSDPIFDEVMIRLSSIASAYRSFITASNGSKETALIKLR